MGYNHCPSAPEGILPNRMLDYHSITHGTVMVNLTRFFFLAILLPVLFTLTACQATLYEKGTVLDTNRVAQIQVGRTTRAEVKDLLGVPTIVNSFRRDRWVYVQDRQVKNIQRTFARVINRVEITFDKRGVVYDIKHNFGEELLNPQTLPEARNTQNWFGWLWGGEYMRPAIAGHPPTKEKEAESSNTTDPSSAAEKEPETQRPATNPWWKVWSSDKE